MATGNSPAPTSQIGKPTPPAPRAWRYAVFASPKSGTTWVQRLLSAHPQVHCAESRAFGRYFDPHNPTAIHLSIEQLVHTMRAYYHPPAGIDPDLFYDDMLFRMVDAVGRTAISTSGKPIYGEKITPFRGTAGAVVDRLHAYNPDLRFVHLVRDPRDVIVSGFVHQANIRMNSGHPQVAHYRDCLKRQVVDDDILDAALDIWLDCASAASTGLSRFEHALLIRYEDLLADPQTHSARLLNFIGADGAETDRCVERASFRALSGGREEGEEDRASFFRKGIAGDWVNWLSAEQTARIVDQASNLMTEFGYAVEVQA